MSQEQIDKIEIVLENCEVITVEGKHIGHLNINNIKYSIRRVACNYIEESYVCESFTMSIHRDCNKNKKLEFTLGSVDEKRSPLDRIHKEPDITSIYVHFTNQDKPKCITAPWSEDSNQYNKYQKTYMNSFNDLFIVIDKDNDIKDYFDLDEIENKNEMESIWNILE